MNPGPAWGKRGSSVTPLRKRDTQSEEAGPAGRETAAAPLRAPRTRRGRDSDPGREGSGTEGGEVGAAGAQAAMTEVL